MKPTALWCVGPGEASLQTAQEGQGVLVHTLFSGISRGTENLIFHGLVPESEYSRMRGPHQEGEFPFPVKYGYSNVGRLADSDGEGQLVFALYPHQSAFRLPADMLTPVPPGVPPERAVLGANMETALTIVWDSGVSAGDTVAVVGGGVIGLLVGYLAAQMPGTTVTLVETNTGREQVARSLGMEFSDPGGPPRECDVVIHASATAEGLSTALESAGQDATVVEASWHGQGDVPVQLGGAFHSKRLRLISSQVGHIPPARTPRWSHQRRLQTALLMLVDPRLDTVISGETAFVDLADHYGAILSDPLTLCHRVRYSPN